MKLIITDPVPVKDMPKDSYIVEIQSMQGDGDGYRDFTVGPFVKDRDEASLQSLLETLERMKTGFPPGVIRNGAYRDVLGFLQWFGTEEITIESLREYYPDLLSKYGEKAHQEIIDLTENHYSEWHGDALTDYTRDEKLTKYGVVYYDKTGTKYNVEIQE
jgi:hypothetical protein